ncbi:hypothetical protein D9758_016560 [Tetrapyrgos nigripes]|uniref:Uncharacterized protein n=1 Tax=Tetrapyrgos nigripes TaxID=182062 RepID=A0A8H5FD02_9AGAR|nr:hypothetical protein D9758_016560 [Tetrapyrgos nigripes]
MWSSRAAKVALKVQLNSIHARVTRNRLTTVFFLFGFFHCIAQGLIQSFLFTIDSQYSSFLDHIIHAGQVPKQNHTDLLGTSGDFRLQECNFIPHRPENCSFIFDSRTVKEIADHVPTIDINQVNLSVIPSSSPSLPPKVSLQVVDTAPDPNANAAPGTVNIPLNGTCLGTLLYAQQHLQNSKREDIVFLALQFWIFGISVIAMCYDSVPHVLAVLGARILLTAWAIYALWRTEYQQSIFKQMIEDPGTPCAVKIFPTYSSTRVHYEIPDLVLNCTALGIALYLSWSLLRVFNSEKVQRIGAPEHINRIYKVCLQLEVFGLMAWMGLWLDQLFNSYIHVISTGQKLYEGLFIVYTVALVPWMVAGWIGIRFEKRNVTAVFIFFSIGFFTLPAAMFRASTYRWTYYAWPCWGAFTTASLILLIATAVLSILCFKNFNKGLSQYLHAESALASSNFVPEVFEHDVEKAADKSIGKHDRLSFDQPLPTYYLPNLHANPSFSDRSSYTSNTTDTRV